MLRFVSVDRAQQVENLVGRSRTRIHLRASPLDDGLGELWQLLVWNAERTQLREPGEARELRGSIGGPAVKQVDRDEFAVEAQRRRQAERVERAVRQAVAPADRLGHRVPEREARARERLAGLCRTAEQVLARAAVARIVEDTRERRRDR